ncbi:uncharacterized protein LOC141708644 [Apium graveolens]|uniref:uncharacterized protein LOC141708644 n=1 Tax=Apium graveolens TaxID=4045 RepID=UPI003D7905F8
MDKSWIFKDRDSLEYEIGVESFLIFAEENSKDPKNIPCPCGHCDNFRKYNVKVIRGHLYEKGFSLGYTDWIWHGETSYKSVRSSAGSTFLPKEQNAQSETIDVCEAAYNSDDHDSYDFNRFVADAEQPLYKGSECTKLESMLKLHNWKSRFGISDNAFTDLLTSVGSFFPQDHVLPVNAYEAKKTLSDLGLEYIKFHACPNNCILYRGINLNASECPKCRLSRWKVAKDGKLRVNSPAKVMWYFPIISRFKRIFKSPDTAEQLIWHSKQQSNDGQMRHPADSPSWRNIDYRWPSFANDPRNLRLALGADGINPFNNGLSNRYNCWQSKDNEASHRDMLDMGVRADLAPQVGEKKTYLPPSAFTLSKAEKRTILSSFLNMKLPYGHASNIKNCVSMADLKIYGLNKVVDVSKLDKLQSDVILTLCELEKNFHASFFDVMKHLIVHLVWELRLCGPVCYRWMYAFEWFNKVMKSYVRNRYHPEGCIAESYLGEESVEFCTEFLKESLQNS